MISLDVELIVHPRNLMQIIEIQIPYVAKIKSYLANSNDLVR